MKFKPGSEACPLKMVASEVTKAPSKNKGVSIVVSIQKTLNNRYGFNQIVDGIPGPKTKSALIKALRIKLNEQFKKSLLWMVND